VNVGIDMVTQYRIMLLAETGQLNASST